MSYVMCNTPLANIFIAQGGKCFICNKVMHLKPYSYKQQLGWTREHFVPLSILRKKNLLVKYNTVLSHSQCNMKRGNKFPSKLEIVKFLNIYKNILKLN